MVLSVSIGDTTFILKITSDGSPASLFSVEEKALDDDGPNTTVQLRNFSGTLFISRSGKNHGDAIVDDTAKESGEGDEEIEEKTPLMAPPDSQRAPDIEEYPPMGRNKTGQETAPDFDVRSFGHKRGESRFRDSLINQSITFASRLSSQMSVSSFDSSKDDRPQPRLTEILSDVLEAPLFRSSTNLHNQCQKQNIKLKELTKAIRNAASHASSTDRFGRLPLHYITMNEAFIFGSKPKHVEFAIANIIDAYPDAVSSADNEGCIPFCGNISDWIQGLNFEEEFASRRRNLRESVNESLPLVNVTPIVRWSFSMLSDIVESSTLENTTNLSVRHINLQTNSVSDKVLDNIASLPNLLPSILLIENEIHVEKLTDLPAIRRILLRKELVDQWLVIMLSNGGKPAARAVDYFEILSELTPSQAFGIRSKLRLEDKQKYNLLRRDMIRHIAGLDWILPSLFALRRDEMHRACATGVVQQVLDLAIRNSSLIALIIFDFALNVLLLIAYQVYIFSVVYYGTPPKSILDGPTLIIVSIGIYFFLCEDCLELLISKSWRKFLSRYTSFWNLIEITSVAFLIATTLSKTNSSTVLAMTTGLIWLRLLAFLKGINMQLALFIMSLSNIVASMKWFLIVLCIGCAMFGHMVHTIATTDAAVMCAGLEADPTIYYTTTADYCAHGNGRSLIRAYSIVVGDVTLDDYRDSLFITFIWIVYTIIGVIILLNVLIAIVTTSYDRSIAQRNVLFASARIPILTKYYFLEAYFLPYLRGSPVQKFGMISAFTVFFGFMLFSSVCLVRYVLISPEIFSGYQYGYLAVLLLMLSFAIIAFIRAVTGFARWKVDGSRGQKSRFSTIMNILVYPIYVLVYGLLGINRSKSHEDTEEEGQEEEALSENILSGVKQIVENSEQRIKNELQRFESKLLKHSQIP